MSHKLIVSFMLKEPDEVLCGSDQYAPGHLSVAIFGKSDLRRTQNMLKGLFMDMGMPWELGIWQRQRTPSLLCSVCGYNELDPSNIWNMDELKYFHSDIYMQCYINPNTYMKN